MQALVAFIVLGAPLFEFSTEGVDRYLTSLLSRECSYGGRVVDLARAALGTPYAGDPLGEGAGAPHDADPLMDLGRVDCVTYVEQTFALAAADSYTEAFDILQRIRYRDGAVGFENRNHFMIADWIVHNTFCRDVTAELGVATEKSTRTIGRRHFYTLKEIPEFAATAADQEMTLSYVPVASAPDAEKLLPSPSLILLIGKVDWLFVLHCGLYIRDADGRGLFYNASSKEGKVVAPPFQQVFENTTRYVGFTAYEIAQPTR